MKFEKLDNNSVSEVESKYVEHWNKIDILTKSTEGRKDGPKYVFYDGPIYANAKPGIHHK